MGNLHSRVWFFRLRCQLRRDFVKVGLCRVIRICDGVINTGSRLFVICWKYINWRSIGNEDGFSDI